MSRMHDDRKDLYSREGVLTNTSNIRNIHTISQSMEKDKVEKNSFGQHTFVNDSGFRAIDLIKPPTKPPQGRSIVPASLGSTQLRAMPPLLPNYISGSGHLLNPVPINHSPLVRGSLPPGQHAFQTHIPVGLGSAAIAPPRGSGSMSQRSTLPSLKPTNLQTQITLPVNPITGLPTILPPSVVSRTGSPIVTSHGLPSDTRLDSRTALLSDPHHGIRGNVQASSQHTAQATIQVIASGTAAQPPHIPTSLLSKGMSLNASANMLKIGVSSHPNTSPAASISASAFKLGIGKAYPGSPSGKSDIQEIRHNIVGSSPYNRFASSHNPSIPSHYIQSHTVITTVPLSQTSTTISSAEPRPHAVGVPYHPISAAAYVFHEMGPSLGLHSFPRSVGALPMFTIDSQHGVPAVPVVSIAVSSKGNMQVSDSHDSSRSEGLTIHGNNSFNIQNFYPNLQPSSFATTFSTNTSIIESSVRPSILRKRPAETTTLFPVQPTEKERISSPLKHEGGHTNIVLPTRMMSPPTLISNEKIGDLSKPTNHSILSITADLKSAPMETPCTAINSVPSSVSKVTVPPVLLTNSLTSNVSTNNIISEASPKKKPRKQLIITTEDKYGSTAPINPCATDEDEEFLKSNETMKDETPPKLTPSSQATVPVSNACHQKLLFPTPATSVKSDIKQEYKETHLNGMVTSTVDTRTSEAMKYYIFRRRPQVSILSEYKMNTKATHNHFYRHSDVKVKDEKKSTTQDRLLSKASVESASGWRLHHLSTQIDDLISLENEICQDILQCKDSIPMPSRSSSSDFQNNQKLSGEDTQLRLLHELIQGNMQRCRYSMEQLGEAKQTMFKVLDHKSKVMDVIRKHKQKPKLKKKGAS